MARQSKSLMEKRDALASFITAWGGKAFPLPLETKFLGWPFALLQLSLALIRGS